MESQNDSNVRMSCIKWVLVVISLTFLAKSVLLITVGAIAQSTYFSQFPDNLFTSTSIILIAVGGVMVLIAAVCIIGAFRDGIKLRNIYYLLSFAFLLEVLTAIAGFVLQSLAREMLIRTMSQSIAAYPDYESVAVAVDFMQRSLECCGIDGPGDWEGIVLPSNDTILMVPTSCCDELDEMICHSYFLSGCLDQMHSIVGRQVMMISIGATTVAGLQILIVLSALFYRKRIFL